MQVMHSAIKHLFVADPAEAILVITNVAGTDGALLAAWTGPPPLRMPSALPGMRLPLTSLLLRMHLRRRAKGRGMIWSGQIGPYLR